MIEAWSADDVRAAESRLMASLPDGELMQRAATGLAEVAAARLQERQGDAVVALVGPGNNGADALYAVAQLADAGFNAAAIHTSSVHSEAVQAATEAGVLLSESGSGADVEWLERIGAADVVIDGILGIGGRPGLPEFARPWVDAIPEAAWIIAVDLPSGQDPAGEEFDAKGVFADETVTFAAPKPVHLLPATEATTGWLTVVDIGLDLSEAAPAVRRVTRDDVKALWPVPTGSDDKYSRGVLGVVAGGEHYTGAAVLSVTAAVSAGVGMVRYVGTPGPEALVRAAVPEAVFGPGQAQAWVVGPGLDIEARSQGAEAQLDCAREALASDLPVLVDAGGLDLIDGKRAAPTLLTPHAGELARLLNRLDGPATDVTADEVKGAPLSMARRLADLTSATVLLKGSTTMVVPPGDATVYSQADAPAWLATAGAGDVLSGLAGALLASGLDPDEAGALAALVHGVAAEAANPGGPVRALGVAAAIPTAVAGLLARS